MVEVFDPSEDHFLRSLQALDKITEGVDIQMVMSL